MTTLAPVAVDESLDPRDPLLRLSRFFDDGSVELTWQETSPNVTGFTLQRSDDGGWELVAVRHGRLVGTATARNILRR